MNLCGPITDELAEDLYRQNLCGPITDGLADDLYRQQERELALETAPLHEANKRMQRWKEEKVQIKQIREMREAADTVSQDSSGLVERESQVGGGGTEMESDASDSAPTIEVDYDVDPTDLYTLLEKRKWEAVLNLLQDLSPGAAVVQASTWVIRREKGNPNGKLLWRLLPLHAAIVFQAPSLVIEALINAYPGAARARDDQGMMPAHLAFRNDAPDALLETILKAYPVALAATDRKSRFPVDCGKGSGCKKKSRADLLSTYATLHIGRLKAEAKEASRAEMADVRKVYGTLQAEAEERTVELERKVEEMDDENRKLHRRITGMDKSEAALQETIKELNEKVQVLSRSLEAASASQADLVESHHIVQAEREGLARRNDTLEDILRRTQDGRNALADRNDMLEDMLRETLKERDSALLAGLDRDLSETQAAKQRMLSVLRPNERAGPASSFSHDTMRPRTPLEKQRIEIEKALLRDWT